MSERIVNMGYLAEARRAKAELIIKINGLRTAVRAALPEFAAIEDLAVEEAAELAVQLAARRADYTETCGRIAALEKALGERA